MRAAQSVESLTALRQLAFLFIDTATRIEHRFDRELANTRGLSFTEYRILLTLSNMHKAQASRVDLAPAVGLTPSAITRALKPLEKLGYVETVKGKRDARHSLAVLTAGGRLLLEDAQGVVDDIVAALPLEALDGQQFVDFSRAMAEI